MISFALATALHLAALQDSATARLRQDYDGCLSRILKASVAKKIEPDAFDAEARSACATEEARLTGALIAYDVKTGSSRADAEEGAKLQIDDYIFNVSESYKSSFARGMERSKAAAAAPEPEAATAPPAAEPETR